MAAFLKICGFTAALSGCDSDTEEFDIESRDGPGNVSCPPRTCGFNSAEVNGRSIRELNLDGVANADGVKVVGFVAPLGLLGNYNLAVEHDELVARSDNGGVLRGLGLLGATILVKKPGLLNLPTVITIAGYSEVESWADGGDPIATYALVYPDVTSLTGSRNVCNDQLLDVLTTTASVLGGETYDLTTKTVQTGKDRWFTIACPGSAADKLRMFGYGPQSDFNHTGQPASAAQRQATLKMITADYCGGGTSYTQNGTPLQWDNAAGSVAMDGPYGPVEAVWTANGAVCLDDTRIAAAEVACDLPSCSSYGLANGEWITHVPPP